MADRCSEPLILQKLGDSTFGLGSNLMKVVGLLQRAPGARPRVPVKKDPRSKNFKVAAAFAIFRMTPSKPVRDAGTVYVDM